MVRSSAISESVRGVMRKDNVADAVFRTSSPNSMSIAIFITMRMACRRSSKGKLNLVWRNMGWERWR